MDTSWQTLWAALMPVADGLVGRVKVLALEEFFVTDVADAMILHTCGCPSASTTCPAPCRHPLGGTLCSTPTHVLVQAGGLEPPYALPVSSSMWVVEVKAVVVAHYTAMGAW
jgi:hypothetical protein